MSNNLWKSCGVSVGGVSVDSPTREEKLAEAWNKNLPCNSCDYKDICKYASVIKRPDYPSEVFEIQIRCKIREKIGGGHPR